MRRTCKQGLFWQELSTLGIGQIMCPWTDIPKFRCGIPDGRWNSEKEKELCANRVFGYQCNCHFLFKFVFSCRRYGVNYCPVYDLSFSWLSKPLRKLWPLPPFPDLQLPLVNWIPCWHLTSVQLTVTHTIY